MTVFQIGSLYYSIIDPLKRTVRTGDNTEVSSNAVAKPLESDLIIPDKVTYDGKTYKVTEIGQYSFCNQVTVLSIKVSANVEVIRRCGFFRLTKCKSLIFGKRSHLTSIESEGMYDFYQLSTLEFNGNCLKYIGYSALQYMKDQIKILTLPSSVQYIEKNNIAGMIVLEHLYYCGNHQITGKEVFKSIDYNTPPALKIHTKSNYKFTNFAERKVTNKDADQYCQQIHQKCYYDELRKSCPMRNKNHFTSLIITILIVK